MKLEPRPVESIPHRVERRERMVGEQHREALGTVEREMHRRAWEMDRLQAVCDIFCEPKRKA